MACTGWHLRNQVELSEKLQKLAISPDDPYSPLQQQLRNDLLAQGVQLVSLAEKPSAILQLDQENFVITPLIIGRSGEPVENKLQYSLVITVVDDKGNKLLARQSVLVERILRDNPNALLSSQEEERILQEEMRKDVVNQVLRRLEKA